MLRPLPLKVWDLECYMWLDWVHLRNQHQKLEGGTNGDS